MGSLALALVAVAEEENFGSLWGHMMWRILMCGMLRAESEVYGGRDVIPKVGGMQYDMPPTKVRHAFRLSWISAAS